MPTFSLEYKTLARPHFSPQIKRVDDVRADSMDNLRKNLIRRYEEETDRIAVYTISKNATKIYDIDGRHIIDRGDAITAYQVMTFDRATGKVFWTSDKGIEYEVARSTGKIRNNAKASNKNYIVTIHDTIKERDISSYDFSATSLAQLRGRIIKMDNSAIVSGLVKEPHINICIKSDSNKFLGTMYVIGNSLRWWDFPLKSYYILNKDGSLGRRL